ncbi:unnamed protein product [Rhizophagus irregularis]|nr:unnamed protein product [Rhizophagus irregularis]CAB4409561.1 unnamed protein product [Rhizophagus irregularis]
MNRIGTFTIKQYRYKNENLPVTGLNLVISEILGFIQSGSNKHATNMNGESSKTKLNKKTFIQSKFHFPEATQSIKPAVTNREKGKYVSHSTVPKKRKDLEPNTTYEDVDFPKQKKPKLKDILLDENFEKLDEKHVYCHYCDTGKSITLHRPNDGDRLLTHINTTLHIDNKAEADKNISKKVRTTFLTQYINVNDQYNDSQHDDKNLQCNINSQYKVCNGFFSHNYAALAKYGTKGKNYQILRNDTLLDGNEKTEGYFKHDSCKGKTYSQFCSSCASLASNESFNKRNRRMQTLLAQIDCLFLLKEGQEVPQSFRTQFNHNSDIEWLNMNYQQLYNVVINTIKHRSGSTTSDALKSLVDYITLELKDNSYHSLIKSYPALGQILEAVEANGLEDWIGKCTTFMINKTMDEQRPVFFGMTQAVIKVLDKMERGVTSMRGIG